MELSSQEGEMPIPLNSTYGGGGGGVPPPHGHMIHHHQDPAVSTTTTPHNNNNNHIIIPSNNNNGLSSPINIEDDDHHHVPYKKMVRYRECLKNHAASMGGNATDGCGEFMPSGEEGSLEALTCSACNCHRNFHRKEIEGESAHHHPLHSHPHHPSSCDCFHNSPHLSRIGSSRKVLVGHHHHHHKAILGPGEGLGGYSAGGGTLIPSRGVVPPPPPHPFIMSYNMGSLPSESDEQEEAGGGIFTRQPQLIKKRFRTKFTQEQKEKMLNFAEKVGWKIQKQEEAVVQQFCQEVGVKRRVLKVWMHNNKHNLAKKNNNNSNNNIIVQNQVIQES